MTTVFLDTSILIRYFAEDDIPRAVAAAALIDSEASLVLSTGVVLEALHVLRTEYKLANPSLAELLTGLLSRSNIALSDADKGAVIAAIYWTQGVSSRWIPDAILAAAAEQAHVDYLATFDEKFSAPSVAVRRL